MDLSKVVSNYSNFGLFSRIKLEKKGPKPLNGPQLMTCSEITDS